MWRKSFAVCVLAAGLLATERADACWWWHHCCRTTSVTSGASGYGYGYGLAGNGGTGAEGFGLSPAAQSFLAELIRRNLNPGGGPAADTSGIVQQLQVTNERLQTIAEKLEALKGQGPFTPVPTNPAAPAAPNTGPPIGPPPVIPGTGGGPTSPNTLNRGNPSEEAIARIMSQQLQSFKGELQTMIAAEVASQLAKAGVTRPAAPPQE